MGEAERTTRNFCNAERNAVKPWFQSDNSKIRKERAHVREVTKVANTGLGAACCGQRDCWVKTLPCFQAVGFLLLTATLLGYTRLRPRAQCMSISPAWGRTARNMGSQGQARGDAELAWLQVPSALLSYS